MTTRIGDAITWQRLSLLLAGAGIVLAGYLTIVHYRESLLVCTLSSCHTVQKSKYAEFGGVPVAAMGLAMYVALAVIGVARIARPALAANLTMIAFAIALSGFAFSLYLTYVEVRVLHAICQWCVLSALIVTALLALEGYGAWRALTAFDLEPEPDPPRHQAG